MKTSPDKGLVNKLLHIFFVLLIISNLYLLSKLILDNKSDGLALQVAVPSSAVSLNNSKPGESEVPAEVRLENISLSEAEIASKSAQISLSRITRRQAFDNQFSRLYRYLSLSQSDLEKLKDILVLRQERINLKGDALTKHGLDLRDPKVRSVLMNAGDVQANQEAEHLLGPQNFAVYRDYLDTLRARGYLSQMENALKISEPLSDQVYEKIITAISPEFLWTNKLPRITESMTAQIEPLLTADQKIAFREFKLNLESKIRH